jgi:DNA-binding transcriptional ArsR family regulator
MEIKSAIAALGALAQETRLGIFRALVAAGSDGMAAGDIATAVGVPAPTLSFHLAQLSQCGLITSVRHGRSIVYAADFEAMGALVGFLTDNCCRAATERCAPACLPSPQPQPGARYEKASRPRQRPRS